MVFRFRMLSDENDNFVRDYEVLYDTTLLEFHDFILRSLEYEECMASFFTADDRWEKLREFTRMDMDDGAAAAPLTNRLRWGRSSTPTATGSSTCSTSSATGLISSN